MTTRNAVCLCTDANMLVPALFTADAVRSRCTDDAYDVIVFTGPSDATDAHRRWLDERGIALCELDLSSLRNIPVRTRRLTVATLMRLLLPERLAGRYDKLLYLDADVMIHDAIAPLFALDTGPHPLAATPAGRVDGDLTDAQIAARDAHFHDLGMTKPYRYINSGVLFIDVGKWNREDLTASTLRFVRENPELCWLPDEDALNAILDGRQAELSPLWNMRSMAWCHPELHEIASPVIVHYDGPCKPWKRFSGGRRLFEYRHAYRAYEAFVQTTPWRTWLDGQWTHRDLRDNVVFELRRLTRRMKHASTLDRERSLRVDAYRRHWADTPFADVEQGIVTREGGHLRLNR